MEDLINRERLITKLKAWDIKANGIPNYAWKVINELPSVNPQKWIPIMMRPMEEDEKPWHEDVYDGAMILNCPLPEDGQEVLISYGGMVMVDVFIRDETDGCYFESAEIDDVEAWMPLPEPMNEKSLITT